MLDESRHKYGRRHINVLISVSTQAQFFTESHKQVGPEKVGVQCSDMMPPLSIQYVDLEVLFILLYHLPDAAHDVLGRGSPENMMF